MFFGLAGVVGRNREVLARAVLEGVMGATWLLCPGAVWRVRAELTELFDPESQDSNVDRWLNMINQLERIHDWTDYEKMHFMKFKFAGPFKVWFHRLDEYDRSGGEWKSALRRAFPRRHDFAEMVDELVARKNMLAEMMMSYFHAKLRCASGAASWGRRCECSNAV